MPDTQTYPPRVTAVLPTVYAILALTLLQYLPPPLHPPISGLVILLAAMIGWPTVNAPEHRHRLRWLRTADGHLSAVNYVLFSLGLSLLGMAVTWWIEYLDRGGS
jgi:hypothetical protein